MRLTVGPLPAAVYWRRRALVLTGLIVLVLVVALSCTGSGSGKPPNNLASTASAKPPATTTAQPTASASASAQPIMPPTSPAFTLPGAGEGSGGGGGQGAGAGEAPAGGAPCTDTELSVAAAAGVAANQRGKPIDFTLRIRNVSTRVCTRDIGAPLQELQVTQGTTLVWSSDDCKPDTGRLIRTFQPGQEAPFTLRWAGRVSRTGTGAVVCDASAQPPAIGAYSLVGRLDKKFSEPVTFRLT